MSLKRTPKPIIQPIDNITGNHCWLSTALHMFANNMGTLHHITEVLNGFLQVPTNFRSVPAKRDFYDKLLFLNNFIVTNIANLYRATSSYKIDRTQLTRVHNDLFGTITFEAQDADEVIMRWISWMDDVSTMVNPIVRNIIEESRRNFLFQYNDINYNASRVEVNRTTEQSYLLNLSVNNTNSCNSLQELINDQSKITPIPSKGVYSYNSKEIILLPDTNFVFIRINRFFHHYRIDTPLFMEQIIELRLADKTRVNFVLQGIMCNVPGHYYYISCNDDGSLHFKYDDSKATPFGITDIDEIRNYSSFLFYSRNNIPVATPPKTISFPNAPRITDAEIIKIKENDKKSLGLCRKKRVPKDPVIYPIYYSLKSSDPVITGAHAISKSLMLFTYSSMDSTTDDSLSPSLFYFYLGSSTNINYFNYLFYLDVQSDFCKTLVNNVPNPDYYDLFNMGESLKDKYNKSIEYTTEQFEKVYKQNEEKPINKEVNQEYTVYNKREIITDKNKEVPEKKYSLFSYSSKLEE